MTDRSGRTVAVLLSLALVALVGVYAPNATAQAEGGEDTPEAGALERFDAWFGKNVVNHIEAVLFYRVGLSDKEAPEGKTVRSLPLIIIVLVLGGIFFTIRYGLINIRLFKHSIQVIRGKYDRPQDKGEVSHFQALTSALSATVGLGNIAGVAFAISLGGAGAVFWMWLTAFLGMSMKFSSCTFAHLYRNIHDDGRILGGPMVYLEEGIKERIPGLAGLGKALAILFAILTIFAAFGGGNMFQGNQTAEIIAFQFFEGSNAAPLRIGIGLLMATLVGIVLLGGIRRIGETTAKLVPAMCVFYCAICLIIILMDVPRIPGIILSIFTNAFSTEAAFGGFIGVLVVGMQRAAFSNEAGVGSAAIAHATARTEEPVREGVVAMMGPFIDTIVVCTMTALTILSTQSHLEGGVGIEITARAFENLGAFAPYVLCIAVAVFAYSTMISWGYYGERATEYLMGERAILPYRAVFVLVVVLGPVLSIGNVLNFSDFMILSMAFPNIIGMILISGKVKSMADDYVRRLKSGEIKPYR